MKGSSSNISSKPLSWLKRAIVKTQMRAASRCSWTQMKTQLATSRKFSICLVLSKLKDIIKLSLIWASICSWPKLRKVKWSCQCFGSSVAWGTLRLLCLRKLIISWFKWQSSTRWGISRELRRSWRLKSSISSRKTRKRTIQLIWTLWWRWVCTVAWSWATQNESRKENDALSKVRRLRSVCHFGTTRLKMCTCCRSTSSSNSSQVNNEN